jgi:hypothetical protein
LVWHVRCEDDACYYRCRRPCCLDPGQHFLVKTARDGNHWIGLHSYDCALPHSVARQVVEELHAGMGPSEIGIARRVLAEALDRLEELEKKRPVVFRETA